MSEATVFSEAGLKPETLPSAGAIDIWFDVVCLCEEARIGVVSDLNATMLIGRPLTNNTLFGTIAPTEVRSSPPPPPTDPLSLLRGRLIIKLESLKARLFDGLQDVEASCVYAAMVLNIDELVLRDPGARNWQLLQQEMFDFTDGGERFFELVDQRLAVAQTSPVVFEIFFYLLSDHGKHKGFQGRHSGHVEQLAQYRRRLQERIHTPDPGQRKQTQRKQAHKGKLNRSLSERPLPLIAYYAVGLCGVFFIGLLAVWLSDLPDLSARRSRVTADDVQAEKAE